MVRLYATALAVLSLLPGPSRADGATAPPQTPASIFAHSTAAQGVLAPGTYRLDITVMSGGLTRKRVSYENGSDYSATETGGPFTTADGSYGGHAWTQDENGIVTFASGFLATEDPNQIALEHPDDPKNNVRLLGVQGTPARIVIFVDPPGGDRELRYYDPQTYLLRRDERVESDGLTHVEIWDDYRRIFGQTRPFLHRTGDGRPDNDFTSLITSFVPAKAPVPSLQPPQSRSLFSFTSNAPVVLPMRIVDGRIVVRATINGRGLDFALDSGSSVIAITPSVANQLGLVTYDHTSASLGGSYNVARTLVPEMHLGDVRLTNVAFSEVAVDDPMGNTKVVGLLGYDLLASGVVAIDFKRQLLTVYPPGSAPLTDPTLHKLAIESDGGVARVPVTIEGVLGHLLLDTGAGNTELYQHYFGRIPTSTETPGSWSIGYVGGTVKALSYNVTAMDLGGLPIPVAEVLVPQSPLGEIEGYDGLLGRDILQNYVIYFDYGNNAVYLKPN